MTHYLGWVMGLSVKQTLSNLHRDRRFHALVRTPQVPLTGKLKGKPKPPSERKGVPATKEAIPVVPASGTRVVEGQSTRTSLPRAFKMAANTKPEDTPSEMLSEKKPSRAHQRRSLLTTSQQWPGTLLKTKAVHWLTVTIMEKRALYHMPGCLALAEQVQTPYHTRVLKPLVNR